MSSEITNTFFRELVVSCRCSWLESLLLLIDGSSVATYLMSRATIQTDHKAPRRQHDGATLRMAPAPALESLLEFQPELPSGEDRVVADRRTVLIVDSVASSGELAANERFTFENLWPEPGSVEPAHRELPTPWSSFIHRHKARLSAITWAWIRPFTWGAAVGATIVFLFTEGPRQMRPANAQLSSERVPFALTAPPSVRQDRIVVTTPPILRPAVEAQRHVPDSRPARATDAAPQVRNVATFLGAMEITSEPAGAKVFVNGRLEGVTPLVIDRLPIGTRAVRVEAPDYIEWSSSVRVVANERTRVGITLTRK
jgi:PEGA domain-containing protein